MMPWLLPVKSAGELHVQNVVFAKLIFVQYALFEA